MRINMSGGMFFRKTVSLAEAIAIPYNTFALEVNEPDDLNILKAAKRLDRKSGVLLCVAFKCPGD